MKQKTIKRAVFHIHTIKTDSESDEYGTPKWLYHHYCNYYGIEPKLDVAASKSIHCCDDYWTKEDDMFTKSCHVDFYMNPFYSEIERCMEWAWTQVRENNVNALVCVNAQWGAKWFRKYLWKPYREDTKNGCYGRRVDLDVVEGRVKFLDRFGNIPIYVDKNGKEHENTAMYWTIFAKLVAGSSI